MKDDSNYIKVTYTVDDEEPECGKCDHFGDDFDCFTFCGSKHCWSGYIREELEELNIE